MEKLKKFIADECEKRIVFHNNPHKIVYMWGGCWQSFDLIGQKLHKRFFDEETDNFDWDENQEAIQYDNEIAAIESLLMQKVYLSHPCSEKNMHYFDRIKKKYR